MKKFLVSVAVMLTAVTMNVNAMRDSFLYHMTSEELKQKMSNGGKDYASKVWEEYFLLYGGVANEFGFYSPEFYQVSPHEGSNTIMESIAKLRNLYEQRCMAGLNDESIDYDPIIDKMY